MITDQVYFSPRWKEMLGYGDHEIANHLSSWMERIHPDDLPEAIKRKAGDEAPGVCNLRAQCS